MRRVSGLLSLAFAFALATLAIKAYIDDSEAISKWASDGIQAQNHEMQEENDRLKLRNDETDLEIREEEGRSTVVARKDVALDESLIASDEQLSNFEPSSGECVVEIERIKQRYWISVVEAICGGGFLVASIVLLARRRSLVTRGQLVKT